jgi:hypothetical protein
LTVRARWRGAWVLRALRRRTLFETEQGQPVLMRTGAAARDWELGAPLERFVR